MSTPPNNFINFNLFDFFVNIIPGYFLIISVYYFFEWDLGSTNAASLFTLLLLSYIFGHLIQRSAERFYWKIFGYPDDFERKIINNGVSEIKDKYRQTLPAGTDEEITSCDLDSWLVGLDNETKFQTLEAKLINISIHEYDIEAPVEKIESNDGSDIFQIAFSYVTTHGITGRVDRFYAISNLFRSTCFISVLLSVLFYYGDMLSLSIPVLELLLHDIHILEFPNQNLYSSPHGNLTHLSFLLIGVLSNGVYKQYREYMIRALISDFVLGHNENYS